MQYNAPRPTWQALPFVKPLASALREMARTVCARNDGHEAYKFEREREIASVLLVVLVREINAG